MPLSCQLVSRIELTVLPRHRRLFLPHMPLHIVQRGHDRQPVFVELRDYEYYLSNLVEMKSELSIRVFAYCLMTNHVHLLIAPDEKTENVSRLLRVLAGRQTRHVNRLEKRTGTLWEGRFKASLVDSDAYLLACYRYIDLNPVRAMIVDEAGDYQWSSYRQHTGHSGSLWLDRSDVFEALGETDVSRSEAYRLFVSADIDETELAVIRNAVKRNQITGTQQFQTMIALRTGRRVSTAGPGRPKSKK